MSHSNCNKYRFRLRSPVKQAQGIEACARRAVAGGFTLAEMLIVLAILAVTTTIAVQSLVPVATEARYQATQQTLTTIRNAIVGAPAGSISSATTSGFVVDMGRLPQTVAELFNNPSNASATQTFAPGPSGSTSVAVVSGWNGPYIATPIGQTAANTLTITDGWGHRINGPLSFIGTDWTFWSSGPNGVDDSSGVGMISNDDIPLVLYATDYQAASITVTVAELSNGQVVPPTLSSGDYIAVYLYAVNGANVTNDRIVINPQYDGLFGALGNVQATAYAMTTYSTPLAGTYQFYYGSQSTPSTLVASPVYTCTFSPTNSTSSSPPSLPVTLNVGTVVLQAIHYSAGVAKRSVPLVTTLAPRSVLNTTLVMQ